ncbi:putative odorant-binding protein A5 [Episyrphus balteatus]|uniref:putative odorant-binding protein A5 n=1 Tax=Episyrphus balteatus TaxID=286459 RepID=UPI0024868EF3|nr:putative odorant-binding protein A5 [Episyrphus balteatus]
MKINILLIVALFSVASAAESEITKKMKEFKIIPDFIPSNVPELLKVTFDSGAALKMGNVILPSEAKNQPTVDWNADKNTYYTVMAIAPDAPSPDNPFLGPILTWMVGNIRGKDIDSGRVLAEYFTMSSHLRHFKSQSVEKFPVRVISVIANSTT